MTNNDGDGACDGANWYDDGSDFSDDVEITDKFWIGYHERFL